MPEIGMYTILQNSWHLSWPRVAVNIEMGNSLRADSLCAVSKAVEKSFLDKETSLACLLSFHEKSQSENASFYLQ